MKIEMKHLTKNYDRRVLDNISFHVEGIGALGIIGESGCGKSTLLRILAGIEGSDSGTCKINGRTVYVGDKEYQSRIGYVFQKHNLFPHMTLKENIELILTKCKKFTKKQAADRACEVLSKLHLGEEMEKKPAKISGGQAQRASIARAISTNPELIFLDEPTASLDPALTKEVLREIQELKKDGKEFIFVTHELEFLRQFADYIVYLKDGEIIEYGNVEILEHPETDALAAFLKGEKDAGRVLSRMPKAAEA